ncbi:MAG: CDP-alcohol phosphatidyltransferase family protein [Actinobacteria bacterium]|nr:CDP-alcohol phosphatidyltransferase family protein [Actinomycetota bacterium]MBW3641616.1 CDP-alcohol phosphatidyltransferase family protein [Actinomycetota bacterium]
MEIGYALTRYVYRPLSAPAASVLAGTPVSPNQVTYASAALSFGGGAAFAMRAFVPGAILTLMGSFADCLDGDLARITDRATRSGSYLDHVFDRWTDAALVVGLTFSDLSVLAPVGFAALVGTFMTSYTRTKAQALGTDCQVGIGGRDTRMLILVVAGLFGRASIGLRVVAVLGLATAVQRMLWTMRHLDARV